MRFQKEKYNKSSLFSTELTLLEAELKQSVFQEFMNTNIGIPQIFICMNSRSKKRRKPTLEPRLNFNLSGFWGFGVLGFWGFGVLGFWVGFIR